MHFDTTMIYNLLCDFEYLLVRRYEYLWLKKIYICQTESLIYTEYTDVS